MKKQFTELIGACFTLVLLLIGTSAAQAQYCDAGYTNTSDDWISRVEFAGIDNESGSAGYEDFTGITGVVAPGASYPITVTIGIIEGFNYNQYLTVYIDFNQNEVFEASEEFAFGFCDVNGCTVTGDIEIPVDAIPGITRMRVIEDWLDSAPGACVQDTYGEVEDYSLLIGGDCTPPDFAYTITDDCELFTYDVTATINDMGGDLGGPNSFVTIYLTRSDAVPVSPVTVPDFLIGQTLNIILDVPFGVSVSAAVEGNDPTCNSTRNWSEIGLCPPQNNECETATELFCGDAPISGSNLNASGYPDGLDVCGIFASPSGAVWYSWTAPYNAIMTTNVTYDAFFDYQVVVLDGTCGDFVCLGGIELGQVTWNATEGETYYIMVHGWGTATGDFNIALNCQELTCDFPELTATAVDSEGAEITDEDCVLIDGTYSIQVNLEGGAGNETFTVNVGGTILTMAAGETNTIDGFSPANPVNVTAVGDDEALCDASATLSPAICPPGNSECLTATPLECGVAVSGTNIGATPYPVGTDICNGNASESGAVWYEFTAPYNAFASAAISVNFDAQHVVFSGDCEGELTCLGWSDFGPINFNAAAGETYYVMVFGWGTSQGTFDITMSCEQIFCNFPEISSMSVDSEGAEIVDCLPVGTEYFLEVNLEGGEGNDMWSVNVGGTGAVTMEAGDTQTFGPFTAASNVAIVATGDLDTDCNTTVNTSHPICPPENDECETAQELICGTTIAGTTIGASDAPGIDFNSCGGNMPGPSYTAWYTFYTETESEISVTESNALGLNGSFYDLEFFVYTGECGGPYTCVAGQNFGNVINFTSTPETQYYVLVSGFAGSVGTFNLALSCVDLTCAPTATATAVDSEGVAIEDCVDQQGEYYVLVDLEGGDNNEFYNVYVNSNDPIQVEAEGSGIVGPVAASAIANISVTGVSQVTCSTSASTSVTLCPPSNDLPCDAIPIANDGSVSVYSNVFSTADDGEVAAPAGGCQTPLAWCNSTLSNTVWFTFVGPESGRATVSLCGPNGFDTQVAVYSVEDCGDYGTYTLAAANDDAGINCSFSGVQSVTAGCFEPGVTYYVQVDSYSSFTQGTFDISVTPENGEICNCVLPDLGPNGITVADTQPICDDVDNPMFSTTFYAPEDLGSQDGFVFTYTWTDNPGPDEVVVVTDSYTIPQILPLGAVVDFTITLTSPECHEADGSIYPFVGGVSQDAFACDPDCEGVPGGTADPGTPCEVDGEPGSFNANCECIPVPENDTCAGAIEIECDAYVVGSNVSATENVGCNGQSRQTVWYSFTAPANGSVFMTTCNPETNFDTDINMYTGTCEEDLVCFPGWGGGGYIDGNSACGFQSWASEGTFDIEAGVTYYIAVTGFYVADGFTPWEGDFGLSLTCTLDVIASINGTVDWNAECGDRDLTVDFYEPGTDVLVASYDAAVNSAGEFTLPDVAVGTFDVITKVDGFLAVGSQAIEVAVGPNALDLGALTAGDINGDNGINIQDVSFMNAAFGSTTGDANFNPLADTNCDGGVNIQDVSTVNAGFGQSGAEAPLL